MTKPNRYRQEALGGLSEPREYNPKPQELAPPQQGFLALDGGVLGPLFNKPQEKPMTLTPKEQALFDAIAEGMDEPGCGWLHELADETHQTAGILGSLVKKGLVISTEMEATPGYEAAYWVELVK
jgi:hypothetical protein